MQIILVAFFIGIFGSLHFERVQAEVLVRHNLSLNRNNKHFFQSVVKSRALSEVNLAKGRNGACRFRFLETKIVVRVVSEEFADRVSSLIEVFDKFVPPLIDALLLEVNHSTELLNDVVILSILGANLSLIHHLNSTEESIFSRKEVFLPHMLKVPSKRFALKFFAQRRPVRCVQRLSQVVCVVIEFEVKLFPLIHPNVGDSRKVSVQNLVDTAGECVRRALAKQVADMTAR